MKAYERLLKYVKVYTMSDPKSETVPSTMRQFDLAHMLVEEMKELGLLVRSERANAVQMQFMGNEYLFDAFNPESREYVWNKAKENYYPIYGHLLSCQLQ